MPNLTMNLRTRQLAYLLLLTFTACGESGSLHRSQQGNIDERGAATVAESSTSEPARRYDAVYMLDRLRETVSRSNKADWSLAPSTVTWSSVTFDVGHEFGPDTAELVWEQWTEPVTDLTLKSNGIIKTELESAVAAAAASKGGRPVEREFDAYGFRFFITASNGDFDDTTFVRISFIGSEFADW